MNYPIFRFSLGEPLTIECSGETGMCLARSEHLYTDPQYLIRYKCPDGHAVEVWWSQDALVSGIGGTPLPEVYGGTA